MIDSKNYNPYGCDVRSSQSGSWLLVSGLGLFDPHRKKNPSTCQRNKEQNNLLRNIKKNNTDSKCQSTGTLQRKLIYSVSTQISSSYQYRSRANQFRMEVSEFFWEKEDYEGKISWIQFLSDSYYIGSLPRRCHHNCKQ